MSLHEPNFMGRDGFIWAQGVVEDRIDPLMLGRVRVRVLGWHTETKALIPTAELHWAYVAMPVTSGSMSGIGQSPTGLLPGSWVMLFFRDGPSAQDPVVLFSLGGIPEQAATKAHGFSDPRNDSTLAERLSSSPKKIATRSYPNNGGGAILTEESAAKTYPRTTNPLGCVLNEPDTNRLARNQNIQDTIVGIKTAQRDTGIKVALDADNAWDEPITSYNAQYPFNHVHESESGHISEIDDTPNNERLHRFHRTGTFEEIGPDGSKITKVVMDNYTVILRDNLCHIQGVCDVSIDGNANIYVGYNANIEVNNNTTIVTKGDLSATTSGDATITTAGDVTVWNQGDCKITTEGDSSLFTKGDCTVESEGDTSILAKGDCSVEAEGDMSILAKGDCNVQSEGDTLILSKGDTSIETDGSAMICTWEDCNITTIANMTVQSFGEITYAAIGNIKIKSEGTLTLAGADIQFNPPGL